MKIIFKRKINQCKDFFPTVEEFIKYLKENYNKINFDNHLMIEKIKKVYSVLIDETFEETIKHNRFPRRLFSLFEFKCKNCKQNLFWQERGWNEQETKNFLNINLSSIIDKGCRTRKKRDETKNDFIENEQSQLFKYKGATFYSSTHPKCNYCQSNLILKKTYINNKVDNFLYVIKKCSNENCHSHNMNGFDLYRMFLPIESAESHINILSNRIKKSNRLCVEKWISEGLSEVEAKEKISQQQREYSKLNINPVKITAEYLRTKGYSEDEIKSKLRTPSQKEFWIDKGYSEIDSKNKVIENQKNASLNVDYDKILIPNKEQYWINKGYSQEDAKNEVSKRQQTFSLKTCLEKYGEIEGIKKFNDRQIKWQTSLTNNGNLKFGYSKASQKLFYEISSFYNNVIELKDVYFATKNYEYRLKRNISGFFLYDFADVNKKKIIEYNGDQYHANPSLYTENDTPHPFRKNITSKDIWMKDKEKNDLAGNNGFEVYIVWDSDYRKNPIKVLEQCVDFLKLKH